MTIEIVNFYPFLKKACNFGVFVLLLVQRKQNRRNYGTTKKGIGDRKVLTKKAIENRKKELQMQALTAIVNDPLRKGAPGISNRDYGDLFENCINCAVNLLDRSKVTQKHGKIDCIKYAIIDGKKKQVKIEIKQGGSQTATLDRDGKIICSEIRKSDFVCYHPRFIPEIGKDAVDIAINECVFFTRQEFFDILARFNALRTKVNGIQEKRRQQGLPCFKNAETIQTMYNKKSLGRFNAWCNALYFEGMDFQTFCEIYQISNIYNY